MHDGRARERPRRERRVSPNLGALAKLPNALQTAGPARYHLERGEQRPERVQTGRIRRLQAYRHGQGVRGGVARPSAHTGRTHQRKSCDAYGILDAQLS